MTYITIDTNKKQAQQFLEFVKTLPFVKIHTEPNVLKPLTAKDVAFGIGRKATKAEMKEYIDRSLKSESLDLDDLISAYGK